MSDEKQSKYSEILNEVKSSTKPSCTVKKASCTVAKPSCTITKLSCTIAKPRCAEKENVVIDETKSPKSEHWYPLFKDTCSYSKETT